MSHDKYSCAPRPCPLCGEARRISRLFDQRFDQRGSDYFISECEACGLVHQNPAWNQEFYDSLYANLVYDPSGTKCFPAQIERYRAVAEVIQGLSSTRAGASLLDFGCYDGTFLEWLRHNMAWGSGLELSGYDIALQHLPKSGHFYNSLDRLLTGKKRFDIVVLNHVVEHILKPRELTRLIYDSLLAESGHLVIEVPNISFIRSDDFSPFHIQHVNYFSPATMSRLLNDAGFGVEAIKTFKNYDINRDPAAQPTLLAVGVKDPEFNQNGRKLQAAVSAHRSAFESKLRMLGKNLSLGVMGCGDPLVQLAKLLPGDAKITALFDNNKDLWGTELYGSVVRPVEEAKNVRCDFFIICTMNHYNTEQMFAQLTRYVPKEKIVTMLDEKYFSFWAK